jgi:hypothetical protein
LLRSLATPEVEEFREYYLLMHGGAHSFGTATACMLICDGMFSWDAYIDFLDALVMAGKKHYYRICGCCDAAFDCPSVMEFFEVSFGLVAEEELRERGIEPRRFACGSNFGPGSGFEKSHEWSHAIVQMMAPRLYAAKSSFL